MSISTYSELTTAVATWIKRSDLTSQIPDFISIAEKRIKKAIQLRDMEAESTVSSVVGSAVISLPTSYQSPLALWDVEANESLPQSTPSEIGLSDQTGTPTRWCIDGSGIRFDVLAESVRQYKFTYVSKFELSDASPTNYLLDEYPSIYLYGALVEASNYIFDDQRAAMWQQRLTAEIELANTSEARRYSTATLRTEFMTQNFDINRGY